MNTYDFIIAGAGCAGLSLAYHISKSSLKNKTILLIDKAPKTENDRTWCFWEKEPNLFESIVYRKWQKVDFYGTNFADSLDLGEYRYKMIRGIDFYQFVQQELSKFPNIKTLYGSITDTYNTENGAAVVIDENTNHASFVFNSIYHRETQDSKPVDYYLLQHFKGWEIQTPDEFFDPEKATLMDFRIEQAGETRFFYVLPLDTRRALIEFTVFSEHLLPKNQYDIEVKAYINEYLGLKNYEITHEEFGVIPMTDHAFPVNTGKHIIHIGTAGGQTKASTGYTFRRIQQHSQALVDAMIQTGEPYLKKQSYDRFKLYDRMLLNIMLKKRYATKDIFTLLFQKNKADTILKFLDEQTTFAEELQIMSTTPYAPFLTSLLDILLHKKQIFN